MTVSSTDNCNLLLQLASAADTHVGLRREENQDSYGVLEGDGWRLFLVADGMGGVKGGAVASRLAIDTIRRRLENQPKLDETTLEEALVSANEAIFAAGAHEPELAGMGTTLVGLAFLADRLYAVNVGDSRAYRIRGSGITQLTNDHTVVNELLRSGAITAEQASNSPVSHMLTRSLGPTVEVRVDVARCEAPAGGDRYLLCSDGLYNLVEEAELFTILRADPPAEAARKLISLANQRGGIDNITVVLAYVADDYVARSGDAAPGQETRGEPQDERVLQPHLSLDNLSEAQQEAFKRALAELQRQAEAAEEQRQHGDAAPLAVRRSRLRLPLAGASVGAAVIIGFYALTSTSLPDKTALNAQPTPAAQQASAPEPDPELEPRLAPVSVIREPERSQVDPSADLGDKERQGIAERRQALASSIQQLEQKLELLDQGIAGDQEKEAALKLATGREAQADQDLRTVRSDLEAATRKLGIWYSRRNRLKDMNPLNMAGEVAVSSESVRQKKQEFETATYEYLKGVEDWKYRPHDKELEASVAALAGARSQRMKELAEEVKRVVTEMIDESDHQIAELTLKREALEKEFAEAELLRRCVEAVLSGDDAAKETLRALLKARKEMLHSELQELDGLIPAHQSPQVPVPGGAIATVP